MNRRRLPVKRRRAIRCVARLVGSQLGGLGLLGVEPRDIHDTSEAEVGPELAQVVLADTGARRDMDDPLLGFPGAWIGGAA